MNQNKKYTEVIWFGRGGQGAITASQLIADAAYMEGYKGVTTAPSFGAERRGAPVSAFLRLSHEPIRIFSQVTDPDVIVVLDQTLLPVLNINGKFRKDAMVIVNSTKSAAELGLDSFSKVGTADITRIAVDNNLTLAGSAILNTPILGAFVKVTNLVSLSSVERAIMKKFGDKAAINLLTAQIIFEMTTVYSQ